MAGRNDRLQERPSARLIDFIALRSMLEIPSLFPAGRQLTEHKAAAIRQQRLHGQVRGMQVDVANPATN
jgi:hypothetical protein